MGTHFHQLILNFDLQGIHCLYFLVRVNVHCSVMESCLMIQLSHSVDMGKCPIKRNVQISYTNPFVPNELFLYPLKISENRKALNSLENFTKR